MEPGVRLRRTASNDIGPFALYGPQIARIQAIYFVITGVWPLLHMRSFEAITGPKADRWLVKTVGVLVIAIGGSLGLAARADRTSPETALLAASSAGGLAAIDIVYVAKRRISPVYLLDAVAELLLVVAWILIRPWRHRAG